MERFRVQQTWRIKSRFRGTSEDIWKEAAAQEMGRERQKKWDVNWLGVGGTETHLLSHCSQLKVQRRQRRVSVAVFRDPGGCSYCSDCL